MSDTPAYDATAAAQAAQGCWTRLHDAMVEELRLEIEAYEYVAALLGEA